MRRTAIIGPGRVGTTLGMALAAAGYDVAFVAGRGPEAVAHFRRRVPAAAAVTPAGAAAGAELVVLCVPDDVLGPLVRDLARDEAVAAGSRWVHVSGGYGVEVLHPAHLAGAAVAACHPAQTFVDPDRALAALPQTSWAVTAAPQDRGWARVLVTDLGGRPVDVPGHARTLYHAGLTVGATATASVVTLARDLLLGAGVTDPAAFLGPLVTTSAAGAVAGGAAALGEGEPPAGDEAVARHLDELRTVMPEAVEAYVALARLARRHARRAGADVDPDAVTGP